jgi:tetratricopeptide (TPR) repeat protein
MIHRDFKPANCIIDEGGRVCVLDFGLARQGQLPDDDVPVMESEGPAAAEPERPPLAGPSSALDERLTMTGSVLGTVAYMAPEQLQGRSVDARADQFSFCVSLWEALFGKRPFFDTPVQKLQSLVAGEPLVLRPPRAGSRVPRWLVRVLERGLAAEPEARWPSMDALLGALERHRRRRSAWWVGVAALAGVAAVGAWPTPAPPSESPCRDAGQAQLGAWGPQARSRVREAMLGSELAYADEVWSTVESQLDAYVTALGAAHVEACEATRIRNEQTRDDLELRTACLDERAAALRQTIAILGDVDVQVMEEAVALVVALPGLEPCADLQALRRESGPAHLRDPRQQERLRALRERLEQARALETAGKLGEGLAAIEPVAAEADELRAPRLRAEARLVEGTLLAARGEHERAAEQLRRALHDALVHGADAVAVEALSALVYVVGVDQAKADAGLWLGSVAEALVDRGASSGRSKARVLTALGQLLSVRGEHAAAQARLEQALELLQAAVGADHIALAEPLDSLGVALRNQGQLREAHRRYQRALEIRIRWQGGRHPAIAHQRVNLGVVLDELGRPAEAQQQLREALEVLVGATGEHHERLAHARTTLGISLARQGSYRAAARELGLAIEAWEVVHGPDHPRVAKARLSLAASLQADGAHEDAVPQFERALAILRANERTLDNEATTSAALEDLATSLEALGRNDEAAAHRAALARMTPVAPR